MPKSILAAENDDSGIRFSNLLTLLLILLLGLSQFSLLLDHTESPYSFRKEEGSREKARFQRPSTLFFGFQSLSPHFFPGLYLWNILKTLSIYSTRSFECPEWENNVMPAEFERFYVVLEGNTCPISGEKFATFIDFSFFSWILTKFCKIFVFVLIHQLNLPGFSVY